MGGITFFRTPTGPDWYPDSSGIKSFAEGQITDAVSTRNALLDELFAQLQDYNNAIDGVLNIPMSTLQMGPFTSIPSGNIVAPDKPLRPDLALDFPVSPDDPNLGTVSPVTLAGAPTFDAVEPTVDEIPAPAQFTKAAPTPTPISSHALPTKPNVMLPVSPALRAITLPEIPELLTVDFTGVLPTAFDIPADIQLNFTEQEYQSILNGQLKEKLYALLADPKILSQAVQSQIWSDARIRSSAQAARRRAEITRKYCGQGWNLPPGEERKLLMEATEASITDDLSVSRDIMIDQNKLEQSNYQFAFTQGLVLEGQLITLHNNVQQRSLERAKAEVDTLVSLYKIKEGHFNSQATLYSTQATVYKTIIEAEMRKLERAKIYLEGQKLIGDLNSQDIANYNAQLQGIETLYNFFKTELEGVKTQLEQDRVQLERDGLEIQSFAEEVKVAGLEQERYKTQWIGQEIKTKLFGVLADAFGKEVDAYASSEKIKIAKLDSDIKVNFDVPLQVLTQQNAAFKTKVDAKAVQLDSLTKLYVADTGLYEADIKALKDLSDVQIDRAKLELDYLSKQISADTEVFSKNVAILLAQKEMLIASRRTEAQLRAQVATSIGGSINFGASISGSSSYDNAAPMAFTY